MRNKMAISRNKLTHIAYLQQSTRLKTNSTSTWIEICLHDDTAFLPTFLYDRKLVLYRSRNSDTHSTSCSSILLSVLVWMPRFYWPCGQSSQSMNYFELWPRHVLANVCSSAHALWSTQQQTVLTRHKPLKLMGFIAQGIPRSLWKGHFNGR